MASYFSIFAKNENQKKKWGQEELDITENHWMTNNKYCPLYVVCHDGNLRFYFLFLEALLQVNKQEDTIIEKALVLESVRAPVFKFSLHHLRAMWLRASHLTAPKMIIIIFVPFTAQSWEDQVEIMCIKCLKNLNAVYKWKLFMI